MSRFQKIRKILNSLLAFLLAALLAADPEDGYVLVVFILAILLIVSGLNSIIYYIFLARYMVGGKMILYKGTIILDFGIFTLNLSDVSQVYVMIYFIAVYIFAAVVSFLKSMESKKLNSPSWKYELFFGVSNLAIALLCVFNIGSIKASVYIFCFGLIHSGICNIISALRKTEIVYIQ